MKKSIAIFVFVCCFLSKAVLAADNGPNYNEGEFTGMIGEEHPSFIAIKDDMYIAELPISKDQPGYIGDLKKMDILFSVRVMRSDKTQGQLKEVMSYKIETDGKGRKYIAAQFRIPEEALTENIIAHWIRIYPVNNDFSKDKDGYYLYIIPSDSNTQKDDKGDIAYGAKFVRDGKDWKKVKPAENETWVNSPKIKKK